MLSKYGWGLDFEDLLVTFFPKYILEQKVIPRGKETMFSEIFEYLSYDWDGDEIVFDRCILKADLGDMKSGSHVDLITINAKTGATIFENWNRESVEASEDESKCIKLGEAIIKAKLVMTVGEYAGKGSDR